VVLSYSYWERQFGGAPSVVGKLITINNIPFTVVGVGPPGFFGLDLGIAQDLWLPLSTQPRLIQDDTKPASWEIVPAPGWFWLFGPFPLPFSACPRVDRDWAGWYKPRSG